MLNTKPFRDNPERSPASEYQRLTYNAVMATISAMAAQIEANKHLSADEQRRALSAVAAGAAFAAAVALKTRVDGRG